MKRLLCYEYKIASCYEHYVMNKRLTYYPRIKCKVFQKQSSRGVMNINIKAPTTLLKRDFSTDFFLWICEIFKNTFSMEHPWWLLLTLISFASLFASKN